MSASETVGSLLARFRPIRYLIAAVVVTAWLLVARRYLSMRSVANARAAEVYRATGSSGEEIEAAQAERIRLSQESAKAAARAGAIRERISRIAQRVDDAGYKSVAAMVREWNR